ncbi:hypothetical protein KEH51_07395 [[Brevibacterium] frigoritolerans]|uniref:Uncharacterized protein n=1 Tax=Peribacillus frigoritolerans TaxID=450367 RepID=A0A941FI77_9BACI|nr:hypothetical protein [Peribacillus frigoritolerans]
MKVLHSFPVEKAKRLGVQPDGMMRLDVPYRKKSLMENVSNLIKLDTLNRRMLLRILLKP